MADSREIEVARVPPEDEEITLVEIANTLLRQWRVVVGIPVLFAVVIVAWGLAQDREYVASATLLPQTSESRAASGAAALAQQMGLSLGADRAGQSPQFFVELLASRSVLEEAVQSEYAVPGPGGTVRRGTLIDLYETRDASGRSTPLKKAAERLAENLSATVARESGVIRVSVVAEDPGLAEQIAGRLIEILHGVNLAVRRAGALEEGRFIGERVAEARAELTAAETALQSFLQQNRAFSQSPELQFEHDRLQRQVAMRQEVFTALVRSREQARIDGVRDTPAFAVVDAPDGSAEPVGRGLAVRLVIALLLGLMVSFVVAFVRDVDRRRRAAGDHQYMEFHGLAHQAWEDLRDPRRWLRRESRRESRRVAAGDH